MTRDQDRVHLVWPFGDQPDRLDDGQPLPVQAPQQRVLASCGPFGKLLERVQRTFVLDEAHDVPADAADQVDEALGLPLLERHVPRKVEKARMPRTDDELELRDAQFWCWIVELSKACTPPGLAITVLCAPSACE